MNNTPPTQTPTLTREIFRELLNSSLRNIFRQSGSDTAFTAVVMRELNKLARERGYYAETNDWTPVYAKAIMPSAGEEDLKKIGARDVLQAFPDICTLQETVTGDTLHWMHADAELVQMAAERAEAKDLLRKTMETMVADSGKSEIACSALKLRLGAQGAPDEKRRLGFRSFREWLENCSDIVAFVDFRSGGRVRLLGPGETATRHMPIPAPSTQRRLPVEAEAGTDWLANGYIIVESASVWRSLKEMLGHDPDPDHAPGWDTVMKFFRARWPADVWKGIYFVYAHKDKADALKGFFQYLSGNSYYPVHLFGDPDQANAGSRSILIPKVREQIEAVGKLDCHLVVVSNSATLAGDIQKLLEKPDRRGRVAVCGLVESMEAGLLGLRGKGVELFDLERDIRCIRKPLPRFRPISADQFDPTRYL